MPAHGTRVRSAPRLRAGRRCPLGCVLCVRQHLGLGRPEEALPEPARASEGRQLHELCNEWRPRGARAAPHPAGSPSPCVQRPASRVRCGRSAAAPRTAGPRSPPPAQPRHDLPFPRDTLVRPRLRGLGQRGREGPQPPPPVPSATSSALASATSTHHASLSSFAFSRSTSAPGTTTLPCAGRRGVKPRGGPFVCTRRPPIIPPDIIPPDHPTQAAGQDGSLTVSHPRREPPPPQTLSATPCDRQHTDRVARTAEQAPRAHAGCPRRRTPPQRSAPPPRARRFVLGNRDFLADVL